MTNWPIKTLGDLMTVQNGYAFDSQYFSPIGKIGLIRIRDLKSGIATETQFVGKYDNEYIVTSGDYLIGMDGEFRCYEWKGDPALLNQRVCRLRDFGKSLDARFLFYGINKFLKEIEDVTGYTTVKHLSSKSILAIEMPVPPLAEQKRIVALLDAATARITELTACYEQARTHANDLFTSALCCALESNLDWPFKALGDICEVFDDGDWIESKDQAPSGVRLIQTGNVGDGEFKDRCDKARFISEQTFSRLRCTEIYPGDLLFSRLPDPVGRACVIPDIGSKMITAVDCTIMRPRKEIMLPQFLVTCTQTNGYREQVRAKITGTTRDRISRSNLAEVQVQVPSLQEQKQIVARLDSMKTKTLEMVDAYDMKLTSAKNLRQSILEAAFKGDL